MLQLSKALLNRPVLSLRTGTAVATASEPIINPNNLKIEGLYCEDRFDKKRRPVLLSQDIREILPEGLVVNDHEALSDPAELVRLKSLLKLNFTLIGKPVVTISKYKVGRVNDYAVDTNSLYIQKLYVGQSLLKSIAGGNLSIDRTQIIEITPRQVVINDLLEQDKVPARAAVPA